MSPRINDLKSVADKIFFGSLIVGSWNMAVKPWLKAFTAQFVDHLLVGAQRRAQDESGCLRIGLWHPHCHNRRNTSGLRWRARSTSARGYSQRSDACYRGFGKA